MQPIHSLSRPVSPTLDVLDGDAPVDDWTAEVESMLEAIDLVRELIGNTRTRNLLFQCSGALR